MKTNIDLKNRKGISTVVGSVFFMIVFASAVGYVTYSMNQIDKFGEAVISKSQDDRNRQQEEFEITSVTKDKNHFNITVQNSGQIPVNITRLWVQNRTDPSWPVSKFAVNQLVAPGQTLTKIGQNLPVMAMTTQAYDLTIATERGNTQEALVNSASAKPIYLQVFALPENLPTAFTTTVLFAVTNNMSNNAALTNLQPNMTVTSYGATATLVTGPDPSQYLFLDKGDTAYFKWVYNVTGTSGQKVNFKTSLKNGYLNNAVSRNVTINAIQGLPTTKTVMFGGFNGTTSGTTQKYVRIGGDSAISSSINALNSTIPISGTFKNLYTNKITQSGGSTTVTITLYKNGVAQTLTCVTPSSAPSSCSDTTHSVSVSAGDTLVMGVKLTSNGVTVGNVHYTLEFDPS